MVSPTERYCDSIDGNNANGGTSSSDAWQTLEYALNTGMNPIGTYGNILYLRGTHTLSANWPATGHMLGKPLTIVGADKVATVWTNNNGSNGVTSTITEGAYSHFPPVGTCMRGLVITNSYNGAWYVPQDGNLQHCEVTLTGGAATRFITQLYSIVSACKIDISASSTITGLNLGGVLMEFSQCVYRGSNTSNAITLGTTEACLSRNRFLVTSSDCNAIDMTGSYHKLIGNIFVNTHSTSTKTGIVTNTGNYNSIIRNNIVEGFKNGIDLTLMSSTRMQRELSNNTVRIRVGGGGTAYINPTRCAMPNMNNETVTDQIVVDPANGDWTINNVGSIRGGAYQRFLEQTVDRGSEQYSASGGIPIARGMHGGMR